MCCVLPLSLLQRVLGCVTDILRVRGERKKKAYSKKHIVKSGLTVTLQIFTQTLFKFGLGAGKGGNSYKIQKLILLIKLILENCL